MKKINWREIVLFENEDYVVVSKPPYMSTLDDRSGEASLIDMVREHLEDGQICHRLDKETSGAIAIAKNPEAYRSLSIQFEKRKVTKVYHAVVNGIVSYDNDLVSVPLTTLNNGIVRVDFQEGKPSETVFSSLEAFKYHTLVECRPVTGRMHQIRVHLAWKKAPIAGDDKYGGQNVFLSKLKKNFNLKKDEEERPLMQRVALHAYSLKFVGLNNEEIEVVAPYPKDLDVLVKQLRKFR
jgi:23S rRNA pseudouridine955/2504/2580 synthase